MGRQLIAALLVFGATTAGAQARPRVPLSQADSAAVMREGLKGVAVLARNLAREDRRAVTVILDSSSVGFRSDELRRFVRDSLQVESDTAEPAEYRLMVKELWRESDSTAVVRVRLDRAGEGKCPTPESTVFIVRRGGVWERNVTAPHYTVECPHIY